jgi:hypothetical protein
MRESWSFDFAAVGPAGAVRHQIHTKISLNETGDCITQQPHLKHITFNVFIYLHREISRLVRTGTLYLAVKYM